MTETGCVFPFSLTCALVKIDSLRDLILESVAERVEQHLDGYVVVG